MAHQRVIRRDTVTAQNRSNGADDFDRFANIVELANRNLFNLELPRILEFSDVVRQQHTHLIFKERIGKLCLSELGA